MADIKINWAFNLTIDGKINLPVAPPEFAVTAYDMIRVSVPAATDPPASPPPPPPPPPGPPPPPPPGPPPPPPPPPGPPPAPVPATVTADVQPSAAIDRVLALIVTADKYDPLLSYSVTSGGTTKKVVLDGPQLFLGAGMVSALANPFPQQLTFTNGKKEPFTVTIFVGRKA